MQRRTVLGAVSVLALPVGGCLSGTAGDNSCIALRELSEAAQSEVRTAIETGEYEACEELELLNEIDLSNDPVLLFEESAYEPVVAHGDAGPNADCSSTYTLTIEQSNRDKAC